MKMVPISVLSSKVEQILINVVIYLAAYLDSEFKHLILGYFNTKAAAILTCQLGLIKCSDVLVMLNWVLIKASSLLICPSLSAAVQAHKKWGSLYKPLYWHPTFSPQNEPEVKLASLLPAFLSNIQFFQIFRPHRATHSNLLQAVS